MVTKPIDLKWIYSLDRYAVFFLVGKVRQYPAYAHVQQYMGALAYGFCCTSFSDVIYLKTPFVNGLFHFICPVQSGNKFPTSWFGFCCHFYFLWMETNKMNTKYITDNNRLFVFLTNASILQSWERQPSWQPPAIQQANQELTTPPSGNMMNFKSKALQEPWHW